MLNISLVCQKDPLFEVLEKETSIRTEYAHRHDNMQNLVMELNSSHKYSFAKKYYYISVVNIVFL